LSVNIHDNQVISVTPENIQSLEHLLYWIAPTGKYRKLYDCHDMPFSLLPLEQIHISNNVGLPIPVRHHTNAKELVQISANIATTNSDEFKKNSENECELRLFREFLLELKDRYSHDHDVQKLLKIPNIQNLIETQN